MLDIGESAERHRRLAIAGLHACRTLLDLMYPGDRRILKQIVHNLVHRLEQLPNNPHFWPHRHPPEIENYTEFEIDSTGRVINHTGMRVQS
jgi:hypothetical protein